MFVTFCAHTRAYLSLSLSLLGRASGRIGALCGSCRWGIEALSVVNTRVIIVAGHLGPQARHIRSLTIQSSRSKATANKLFRNNGDISLTAAPLLKIHNSTRAVNLLNARITESELTLSTIFWHSGQFKVFPLLPRFLARGVFKTATRFREIIFIFI